MFNLVEVQTALQSPSVQLADLMKYANGSSAEVPAYLALGELNRRKQLEATNTDFNAKPPTVKDQLTNAPPAVNPTAAPTGIAPTGAPPAVNPVAAPPRMNVAAAPANQVNPAAPPQLAAEGGLLSIPTPHMFKQESYATGGIVAFSGTDDSFVDPKLVERPTFMDKLTGKAKDKQEKFDRQSAMLAADFSGNASDLELPANAPPHPYSIEKFLNDEQRAARRKVEGTDVNHPSPVNPAEDKRQALLKAQAAQAAADKVKHDALVAQVPTFHVASDGTIKGTKPAEAPVEAAAPVAAPAAQSGIALLPRNKPVDDLNKIPAAGIATPAPVLAATPVTPTTDIEDTGRSTADEIIPDYAKPNYLKPLTREENADNKRKAREDYKAQQKEAGIAEDPLADIRKRYSNLEAQDASDKSRQGRAEIGAALRAFSQANPNAGFGVALGIGGDAAAKLSQEHDALNHKQALEMAGLQQALAEKDDARKRGDFAASAAADDKINETNIKIADTVSKQKEVQIQAAAAITAAQNADTAVMDALSHRIGAIAQQTQAATAYAELPIKQKMADNDAIKAQAALKHAGNPHATPAEVTMLATLIKARPGVPVDKVMTEFFMMKGGTSKADATKERREKDFVAWKGSIDGIQHPDVTYQQYSAQFADKPDSSKLQAGRDAMKP